MIARPEKQLPLVVIAGPTASGKTTLALTLAKRFGGEIICADSRTVYKGMNIGTAKPTAEEQGMVPHWGIDLVEPCEPFSAADFKSYACRKIEEIRARGNIPFMVGGTGLYIDAVVFDYTFGPKADYALRESLKELSLEMLHDYCARQGIPLPENKQNRRYVIRAIERKGTSPSRRDTPIDRTIIVGISTDRELLSARIRERAEHMFNSGVVEETALLSRRYGWECESMSGNVYPLIRQYRNNEISLHEAKSKFTTLDRRLAKRQLTWLRRNSYIKWLSLDAAALYLSSALAHE